MNDSVCWSVCGHSIPPEDRFCGQCGWALTAEEQLAPRREDIVAVAGRSLLTKLKPVGKALAIGAATLAAEAGPSWLRHRSGRVNRLPAVQSSEDVIPERLVVQSFEELCVWLREEDLPNKQVFARQVVRSLDIMGSTDQRH